MQHRQQGMTLIGWLVVLGVGGLFVLAGLRLVPVYLEHMKLVSIMTKVKDDLDGQQANRTTIRAGLLRRYDVEAIKVPRFDDIEIKRGGEGHLINAIYEHKVPFLYNVSFVVDFSESVEIRR